MKSSFSLGAFLAIIVALYLTLAEAPKPENQVKNYYNQGTSDVQVKVFGRVIKLLPDDNKGSRHQKFIIRSNDLSLLIVHNIDIAERVPVKKGDYVWVYGEYEWNEKGGLIHWTHRDLKASHPDGFISHKKKTYH
ncbi:DUF3465 domain-containing protein [Marinicella rhabdoformis]|uniref:DUF3465 domain-containing protein n=1 Tax=Marinicella rhabdoformis TaxID=2580566 RepID=UPI0031B5E161